MFAGANDVQRAIGAENDLAAEATAAMGQPEVAKAKARQAAINVVNGVWDLADSGGRIFLVPDGPDWAVIPAVIALESGVRTGLPLPGYRQFASEVSEAFNDALDEELDKLKEDKTLRVLRFSFRRLLNDMTKHPKRYGFTNVTERCYQGDDLGFSGNGISCSNPSEYMFWDRVHPTTALHRFVGNCLGSITTRGSKEGDGEEIGHGQAPSCAFFGEQNPHKMGKGDSQNPSNYPR